jgi:hypothetical protein
LIQELFEIARTLHVEGTAVRAVSAGQTGDGETARDQEPGVGWPCSSRSLQDTLSVASELGRTASASDVCSLHAPYCGSPFLRDPPFFVNPGLYDLFGAGTVNASVGSISLRRF